MLRNLLACSLVLPIQLLAPALAQISAYMPTNQILAGEIAELVIEFDSQIPSLYALNTAPLEVDFEVLEVKSSVARHFEANRFFNRMRWRIDMLPRRSGNLRIPPLQIGDRHTPELMLAVVRHSDSTESGYQVSVELQAIPEDPYPGQQTEIIMRVLHDIALRDGRWLEPEVENAQLYRDSEESRYSLVRDGKKFRVRERRLALVPQSPGEISIGPASFRGLIATGVGATAQNLPTRWFYRSSQSLKLQVRRPPPGIQADPWLPAKRLRLEQHWDDKGGELKLGDSIGLSLGIEARGLSAEALPANLLLVESDQFKVFADREVRSSRIESGELVARLDQRFAVILTQAGEIEFPATGLKWWDVTREQEMTAILEGKSLVVTAASTAAEGGDPIESDAWRPSAATLFDPSASRWFWYLLAGFALLIPGLLIGMSRLRLRWLDKIELKLNLRHRRKLLKQACLDNSPGEARSALIAWSRACWPQDRINNLSQIDSKIRCGSLGTQLRRLDEALYSAGTTEWQGHELWRELTGYRGFREKRATRQMSLPVLYPEPPEHQGRPAGAALVKPA